MQRYTETMVKAALASLKSEAKRAGIKGAKHWTLHTGNSSYGYQWRVIDNQTGASILRDLGTTKREAYQSLRMATEAYYLLNKGKK